MTINWKYIVTGWVLLFISSYFDNIRGVILPLLTTNFGLEYAQSSWLFIAGNIAAAIAAVSLLPLARKFSHHQVVYIVGFASILVASLTSFVKNFPTLVVYALLLGFSINFLGSLANILVIQGTPHAYRTRFLSGLHVMYGAGSVVAPMVGGFVLSRGYSWSNLLEGVAPVLLVVMACVWLAKMKRVEVTLTNTELGKLQSGSWVVILAFVLYVPGEVLISAWMTAYFNKLHGYSIEQAAPYVSGFFAAMALSRLLCFIGIRPAFEKKMIWGSLALGSFFFLLGQAGWKPGFSLAGVMGPFYPLLLGRMSRVFRTSAQTLTLVIMMAIQAMLAISQLSMGVLFDWLGPYQSYWTAFYFQVATLISLVAYFKMETKSLAPRLQK